MLDYIFGFLIIYSFFDRLKFFINKRKIGKVPIMKGAEPVYNEGGKTGLLMIHGFSSSPGELKYLINHFKKKGYTVSAPLMKGHGTIPEDLYVTNWEDWVKSVEDSLKELSREVNQIYIIGSSLGGNIALHLMSSNIRAKKYKVKGIVTLSTPINFRRSRIIKTLLPVFKLIKHQQRKIFLGRRDRKATKNKAHYQVIPLRSLSQVIEFIKIVKEKMHLVKVPILVMNSDTDYQITLDNCYYIFSNVSSDYREKYILHNAYHVFVHDSNPYVRRTAFKKIESFIDKLENFYYE